MLFSNARRIRSIFVAIALSFLFLQSYKSWRSSAYGSDFPFIVRVGNFDNGRTTYTQLVSRTNQASANESLPYNINIDSPAKKYANYIVKGCKLWSLLQRYTDAPGTGRMGSESSDERLAQLLGNVQGPLADKGVGITTADGMINIGTTHAAPNKPPKYGVNLDYKPTGAIFFEAYNAKKGAIIAYCNYGPAYEAARDPHWDNAALPGMSSWSDIVSAVWTLVTNTVERRLLRYIIRINIVNEDTTDVVSVAVKKVGQINGIPPSWPGLTFAPPAATKLKEDAEMQKAFQAVLATPNVRGIVWLLLQNKWQLGAKTVKSIIVWDMSGMANQDAGWELAIMVEVADYVPN